MYKNWFNGMTSGQRAAWDAAASTFTILNNRGQTKTPKGYEFFVYWNSYQPNYTWRPPAPFTPSPAAFTLVPPSASQTQPVPTSISLFDSTPPNFTIQFDCATDISPMSAFVQISRATDTGYAGPTRAWRRLAPVGLNFPEVPLFNTPFHSVLIPPFSTTPTYNPPDWRCQSGAIWTSYTPGPIESIATNVSTLAVDVICNRTTFNYAGGYAPAFAWGTQSSGARTGLQINATTSHVQIVSYANWTDTGSTIAGPYSYPPFTFGPRTWRIIQGPTTTMLYTPTSAIGPITGIPYLTGDVTLDGNGDGDFTYLFQVWAPPTGYKPVFNYQAIIENPSNPGIRSCRLTLGDPDTGVTRHSLWVPFTISL